MMQSSSLGTEIRPDVVSIAGIGVAITDPADAAELVCTAAKKRQPRFDVHLMNAYTGSLAADDIRLSRLLNEAGLVLPDGAPVAALARLQNRSARQTRGPRLFEDVFRIGQERGLRHFLLGSTPDTLESLIKALRSRYPDALIVGSYSPPFGPLSEEARAKQDDEIRRSSAEIVWVGLGTPKQDFEAHRVARELDVVAVAIGAAFDFSAGTKAEAPVWMSQLGIEWVFRLLTEPRRLWKRYLVGNLRFCLAVLGLRREVAEDFAR